MPRPGVRRLLAIGLLVWLLRWVAIEAASHLGRRWLPVRPFSPHGPAPGHLPGPFDRFEREVRDRRRRRAA